MSSLIPVRYSMPLADREARELLLKKSNKHFRVLHRGTRVLRPLHCLHADTKHPSQGGSDRQLFNSSEKRVARTLLLLARYGGRRAILKRCKRC
jgi:hypothetical protein